MLSPRHIAKEIKSLFNSNKKEDKKSEEEPNDPFWDKILETLNYGDWEVCHGGPNPSLYNSKQNISLNCFELYPGDTIMIRVYPGRPVASIFFAGLCASDGHVKRQSIYKEIQSTKSYAKSIRDIAKHMVAKRKNSRVKHFEDLVVEGHVFEDEHAPKEDCADTRTDRFRPGMALAKAIGWRPFP